MKKTYNHKEIKEIGAKAKALREAAFLNIADLAEITGISAPTIDNLENGKDVYLTYFIEIAKALKVHPRVLLDFDIAIKPRNKLSPKRAAMQKLTERINKLLSGDFFDSPKFVRDIVSHLADEYNLKVSSSVLTVTLGRFVDDGKLKFHLVGRQKQYYKKVK